MRLQIITAFLVLVVTATSPGADDNFQLPSGDVVAARMLDRDAQRQSLMAGYHGLRRYILDNERMHKHAEILVRVGCDADGVKHFELVSQSGWKGAYGHVVSRMLASEEEASHPEIRFKIRLSPDNYEFHVLRNGLLDDRMDYVLEVVPRRREERLFEGRIWIDAQDYAVVRIEGEPARNPSFWIRDLHFVHTYQKSGTVWFPATTESTTEVRIFGTTTLKINYFDYISNAQPPSVARADMGGGEKQ
ncbi:hypothetical protein H7849_05715 [Alloacidobacterium dinghuense]|uniref:Uncharacterized protein n=1 Tax=Alloacidobacterium dinghuense TaxID=2763107 RepID=A0A7G8BLM5_9BACT|nr:hypothetical protein [Alloacidobacterium dinghuense]QNI33445.1 hypothetical protein H7849_05715 [Alloacidobacterium dinghuense]